MPSFIADLLKRWNAAPPRRTRKRRAVRRVGGRKRKAKAPTLLWDSQHILYQGNLAPLKITHRRAEPHACRFEENALYLNIPFSDLSPKAEAAEIALSLRLWTKSETKRLFAARLAFWSEGLEVAPFRLVVTAPRCRWGSCTARNEIRLNWRLIQAPPALLDYVVAHEVCHILHKNHGRAFWRALEKLMPDYKARRLALRAWEKSCWAPGREPC